MKKLITFLGVLFLNISTIYATNVVSFGDSIPNGYLLKDKNLSYDNLFCDTLSLDLFEYSVDGLRSKQLLNKLKQHTFDDEIEKADIIFIDIGSNDFLDYVLDIDFSDVSKLDEIDDHINEVVESDDFLDDVNDIIDNYLDNYEEILEYIEELNDEAEIYLLNIYNPYFDVPNPLFDLDYSSSVFDEYISYVNENIPICKNCHIIDTYNILRDNKLINVSALNMDPHPNKKGHQKIYLALLDELAYKVEVINDDEDKVYYVLKGDKLKLKEPYKEGYTFVKWDQDLDNIDDNITVKPVFKKDVDYKLYLIIFSILLILVISLICIIKVRKRRVLK